MRIAILIAIVAATVAADAGAQVSVVRGGDENPVLTVARSTVWGGLAGLVLGGAIALVAEEDEADIMKWSFVAGTFGGFGFGVYHVATRERPVSALMLLNEHQLTIGLPSVRLHRYADAAGTQASLTLFSYQF